MPSQNLPKPNLPGQLQKTQVVPGGLSRENPGGTPPNMKVAATVPPQVPPVAKPTQPSQPSQPSQAKPVDVAANAQVFSASMPSRPQGPLAQIKTAPTLPVAPKVEHEVKASPTPSILTPAQSAPIQSQPASTASASVPAPAPTPAPAQSSPTPTQNKTKFKLPLPMLIGAGVLVVVLLGVLLFNLFKPKTSTSSKSSSTTSTSKNTAGTSSTASPAPASITTVTYWGLWEDSQILKEVIADFESKNPSIKIDYRKQSHRDYRERLQQAIASGSGPDIFRYHVAWVPMLSADLSAMPASVMSAAEYKQVFYPTAANNLQVGGQIVGIPLMYDGLALFYNKEMLKTANLSVPTTWAELRTAATKLTVPANISERQSGNITRAGLAIGNADNVDHFSDILALLIIQNGGNPAEANSQYVKDAVTFYTSFIKQDKVWPDRLANSTTAFAKGDAAMIFAPSWRIHDIKNLNPNLDFAVARLPQLDSEKPVTWATFWAEGVSAKSKNKDAAWSFLKYLSTPEVLRKFYNNASQYRAFGEIYPRTDMASELQNSELVGAYVEDAPLAKTWYMSSFTHDNGLNDQTIKYYEDAINTVLSSTNVEKALETAATGVTSVMSKYSSGSK